MDYEKAYKAVLQTATQWIKDGCTDKEKICLKCVFPELRESEDEKIRKEVVNFILYKAGHLLDEETEHKFIAYLEKQKKSLHISETCKENADSFTDEQKEQKPNSTEDMPYITDEHFFEREPADSFKYKLAEYMTKNCRKEESTEYGHTYHISAESILKMAEEELLKRGVVQKPVEWSKEDEKMQYFVNQFLEYHEASDPTAKSCKKWFNNRLKSLRPQPKNEWSEEDEKMIDHLIEALPMWANGRIAMLPSQADEYVERLKSLRPQPKRDCKDCAMFLNGECTKPHWKPSEEQMEALAYAIQVLAPRAAKASEELENLREQLKKLI